MLAYLFGSFLFGALLSLLVGRPLIPLLRRLKAGQTISSDAPQRHQSKGGTPTMGGLMILIAATLATLLYPRVGAELQWVLSVVLCTLAFGLIGFADDYLIVKRGKNLGLRAREKLAAQIVVAVAFTAWFHLTDPVRIAYGEPLFSAGRSVLMLYHVLLLVGMSNAVNLTDGLDGLAAGVSLPIWVTLGLLGIASAWGAPVRFSDPGVMVFCAAMAGAVLGYLWYNAHPAQVFMGDTGSLALGGGMAAAAILLRYEWLLPVVALVPVVEALSVIIQVFSFKTTGKRVFKMSPLHHHFELCEWPETRVVARFAIVSVLCCLGALLLTTLER